MVQHIIHFASGNWRLSLKQQNQFSKWVFSLRTEIKCFNCHRHIFVTVIQEQVYGIGRQSPVFIWIRQYPFLAGIKFSWSKQEEIGKNIYWCRCPYQKKSEKLKTGLEREKNSHSILLCCYMSFTYWASGLQKSAFCLRFLLVLENTQAIIKRPSIL